MEYKEIPVSEAYYLQNPGGLVLVCTRGPDGRYDLAPVAWCCPLDYEPVSKLILVLDTGHRTYADLSDSGEFAVALPTRAQLDLVKRGGSISGHDVDKYAELGIASFPARDIDVRIPEGVAGWMECRLSRIVVEGTSGVVMGEVLRAEAVPEAWKRRIHYVREGLWFVPGDGL
ncbi:MAG: flavin reductase family protein [Treponema sp.]|nr:flavin reductase family protein [Treponema sp.]